MRNAVRTSRSSFWRRPGVMFDQEVQLRPIAKHAEDDLGSEAGIARIERRRAREQQVRSVAARLYFQQDLERGDAGWGWQCLIANNCKNHLATDRAGGRSKKTCSASFLPLS